MFDQNHITSSELAKLAEYVHSSPYTPSDIWIIARRLLENPINLKQTSPKVASVAGLLLQSPNTPEKYRSTLASDLAQAAPTKSLGDLLSESRARLGFFPR